MKPLAVALAALLVASCAPRGTPAIEVKEAWAGATPPGATSGAAFFTLVNSGSAADSLVGVSTPAGNAGVHSTEMAAGVMRMRPVERLEIAAGATVTLKPGADHVMVTGIKQPLTAGTTFPLTLAFEKSGQKLVEVSVRPLSGAGGME